MANLPFLGWKSMSVCAPGPGDFLYVRLVSMKSVGLFLVVNLKSLLLFF